MTEARLPIFGVAPFRETLEVDSMERTVEAHFGRSDHQLTQPFNVSGVISWRWDALARAEPTIYIDRAGLLPGGKRVLVVLFVSSATRRPRSTRTAGSMPPSR